MNVVRKWKIKYWGNIAQWAWFIQTNTSGLKMAINVDQKRMGIEEMFGYFKARREA